MIRIPEVRVIDHDGQQVGVMQTRDALELAMSRGLDLVEISPTARPPVCKVLDFGKYKYELQKKTRVTKKKQHAITMKEMQYRPKIDEHDYQFKTRHVIDFLKEGHKVKVLVQFRGREMAHKEFGERVMDRLAADLADVAVIEIPARMEGSTLSMVVNPKNEPQKHKGTDDAEGENE
ncbi:MAG: translation initiation factor IF-3 [bacterium]|nr:translation initiation factor IF-3 [bacterium]